VARPPRLEFPNAVYHVIARGNERAAIFWDDADRESFCDVLDGVVRRYAWHALVYCLMGNHYHLLLRTPQPNLAQSMRQLNGVYAQRFNLRHGRVGHVLQGRYVARLVQEDRHLRAVVRYIIRNPVRAGLCSSPGGWLFSSHRETLGEAPVRFLDVSGLLEFYGPSVAVARERYRAHVEEKGADASPRHPLVEGDDAFAERVLSRFERPHGVPARYFRRARPELGVLLAVTSDQAILAARAEGYSLREIGRHLGCHASTVSRRLRRYREGPGGAASARL
jgi:putative transposase